MGGVSSVISDYWRAAFDGEVVKDDGELLLTLNPALGRAREVMLLDDFSGRVHATLTPRLAERLGPALGRDISPARLRDALIDAGVAMHAPDLLFYLSSSQERGRNLPFHGVRRLSADDRQAFDTFKAEAAEQDLEDAGVELDHWAAFGAFDQGRLVCMASAYPWDGAPIADLGVLTLPGQRRRGYAREVVQAISRFARDQDHEPQYRCQVDNQGSTALASAASFIPWGKWEVIACTL